LSQIGDGVAQIDDGHRCEGWDEQNVALIPYRDEWNEPPGKRRHDNRRGERRDNPLTAGFGKI